MTVVQFIIICLIMTPVAMGSKNRKTSLLCHDRYPCHGQNHSCLQSYQSCLRGSQMNLKFFQRRHALPQGCDPCHVIVLDLKSPPRVNKPVLVNTRVINKFSLKNSLLNYHTEGVIKGLDFSPIPKGLKFGGKPINRQRQVNKPYKWDQVFTLSEGYNRDNEIADADVIAKETYDRGSKNLESHQVVELPTGEDLLKAEVIELPKSGALPEEPMKLEDTFGASKLETMDLEVTKPERMMKKKFLEFTKSTAAELFRLYHNDVLVKFFKVVDQCDLDHDLAHVIVDTAIQDPFLLAAQLILNGGTSLTTESLQALLSHIPAKYQDRLIADLSDCPLNDIVPTLGGLLSGLAPNKASTQKTDADDIRYHIPVEDYIRKKLPSTCRSNRALEVEVLSAANKLGPNFVIPRTEPLSQQILKYLISVLKPHVNGSIIANFTFCISQSF